MKGMTPKQKRFVEIYLSELNATKAAIGAGYAVSSAHVSGARMLKDAKVRAAIDQAMAKRSEKAGVTADQVVEELRRIGFADIRKLVKWRSNVTQMAMDEETGEPVMRVGNEITLVNSEEIDEATAAAISSISQDAKGALKVRFHSKESALVSLGKHLGLFRDEGAGGGAPVIVNIVDPRTNGKPKAK